MSDSAIRDEVIFICGSEVTPEPPQWLWEGYLACGKLAILAGAAGTGKTSLAIDIGARLTAGTTWPDGSPAPVGNVLIISSEDGFGDTLLPRFLAAGGAVSNFHTIGEVVGPGVRRSFDARRDIGRLDEFFVNRPGPALLIIDPIASVVGGDDHKNAQVRHALQPLLDLAERRGCAVLGISHFSKGTSGAEPLERVTGSLAFGAVPRVVLVTAKNHSTEGPPRVLTRAKVSIGADGGGFAYDVVEARITEPVEIATSKITWGDPLHGSARAILATVETTSEEVLREGGITRWLREFLVTPRAAKDVEEAARSEGYSRSSVGRASEKLAVVKKKKGMGEGWEWSIPDARETTSVVPESLKDPKGPEDPEDLRVQQLGSSVSSTESAAIEAVKTRAATMERDGQLPCNEAERRASGLRSTSDYFRAMEKKGIRAIEVRNESPGGV